jgi:hypothetical protein
MRPQRVSLSAVGTSQWIPLDVYEMPFNVGAGVSFSGGAVATASVQVTTGSPFQYFAASYFQSTTTITINTNVPHGLSVNDSIVISGTLGAGAQGSGLTNVDGTYAVASVVSTTQLTVTSTVSQTVGTSTSPIQITCVLLPVFTASAFNGVTTDTAGTITGPVGAVRLNISAYTSGNIVLTVLQGRK